MLRLGGTIWIRRLNDSKDQGAFNTSFRDYRANAQLFPAPKLETFFEYHQHDSDRLNPLNSTGFDDVSRSGETSVKDLTGDIRRAFGEGRLGLSGGAYYRRMILKQDPGLYSALSATAAPATRPMCSRRAPP